MHEGAGFPPSMFPYMNCRLSLALYIHTPMYIPGRLPLRCVAMANCFETLPLFCLLLSLLTSLSHAQFCRRQVIPNEICSSQSFSNNQVFSSCMDLPVLDSSIHWTYDPSSNSVRMAYRRSGVPPSTWVSWAINPTSKGMLGSQAFVAFQGSSGSMNVYSSSITSYKTQLQPGSLNLPISNLAAVKESTDMIIYATVQLPGNITKVDQVWQEGPVVGNHPGVHNLSGDSLVSFGSIDFSSWNGNAPATPLTRSWLQWLLSREVHGMVNASSWGTLILVGALIGRHLKAYSDASPAWFYFHAFCQTTACALGGYGWMTGLILGSRSRGIHYSFHRDIGIALFPIALLQVAAAFRRPSPDHNLRAVWSKSHLVLGCAIIVMGVINVFFGFAILKPQKKWMVYYTLVLVGLCLIGGFVEYGKRKAN